MKNALELSKLTIIEKIENLKNNINLLRPIESEQEQKIIQKFRLDWNYHSNAIEGNSLNYGETIAFLMHGLTAKGKPLKDHLDIKGHNQAIDFLMSLIKDENEFTEVDISSIHELILCEPYDVEAITKDGQRTKKRINLGLYKTAPNHVRTVTGQMHYYATPQETPIKMKELMDWYRKVSKNPEVHPMVIATIFHHKFVAIHPFDDGNGRMARLLMNFILMKNYFPPVVIKKDKRNEYYSVLSQADSGDLQPFVEYIAEELVNSMDIYIKGAKGESIEEPDDLDKEILLFKKELEGKNDKLEVKRSIETQLNLYENTLVSLFSTLETTIGKFRDMFLDFSLSTLMPKKSIWTYYTFNDLDELKANLREYLEDSIDFEHLIFVFHLNEFKSESNPFGVEVKLFIYFEDYRYKIYYTIAENNEFYELSIDEYPINFLKDITSNYYHISLIEAEIKKISSEIGKDLLSYIKNKNKDPNYSLINIDNKTLLEILNEYTSAYTSYKYEIELEYGKFIALYSDPEHNVYFKRLLERFVLKNSSKINRNIGFRFYDYDDLIPDF